MYVILVNEDNTLIATVKERIMKRSKLVDKMCFLVHPNYKGNDMTEFTVMLEYVLPVSREYKSEILSPAPEDYKGYLKYILPFDTCLTSEAGEVEMHLTFACVEMDEFGNAKQYVRKTSDVSVEIVPISAWSDIIPDSALSAIDQRLIKVDAQIRALDEMGDVLYYNKADNIKYDATNNELQLTAGGSGIGDKVKLHCTGEGGVSADGIPTVDFGYEEDKEVDVIEPEDKENSNVVQF